MEHRNGNRFPLNINVEVWRDNKCKGTFQTSNIGYGGLFLEGEIDILKKGDFIETKITTLHTGNDKKHSMKAIVIHESARGVGLMWADNNLPFFRTLDSLIVIAA